VGTEWVLSGYCNVVQRGPQHLNCFFSPGTMLYRTWFGAPCLEVDATFVQAFLQALRRMVRLTSSAVTCQRTFRSVWYVETKVVLESKLSKPLWCWSRKSSPCKGQRHPKGPNGTHAHTSMQNGRSVDYLAHCTVGEVIDDPPKRSDLLHHF